MSSTPGSRARSDVTAGMSPHTARRALKAAGDNPAQRKAPRRPRRLIAGRNDPPKGVPKRRADSSGGLTPPSAMPPDVRDA